LRLQEQFREHRVREVGCGRQEHDVHGRGDLDRTRMVAEIAETDAMQLEITPRQDTHIPAHGHAFRLALDRKPSRHPGRIPAAQVPQGFGLQIPEVEPRATPRVAGPRRRERQIAEGGEAGAVPIQENPIALVGKHPHPGGGAC